MRVWTFALALSVVAIFSGCGKAAPARSKQDFLESGKKYASQRKYPEAIVEYRNAIKLDAKFGPARAQLADAYLKTNDLANALREAINAADLLPDDVGAQAKAGELLLLAGHFEDAKSRATKALVKDPKNVAAQILRANASAGLKDIEHAIADIDEALKTDPQSARAYASLGVIEMGKGRAGAAEIAFKQAVEASPKSLLAQLALANFYWSSGRPAQAEPPLLRAVELDPGGSTAQRALVTFYLSTNRANEAEAPLKAMAARPGDRQARLMLADYYNTAQRTDEAVKLLKTVATEEGGFAEATLRLASIDYAQKRAESAHLKVDAVLAKEPQNAPALMLKARFLMSENKSEEGLARAKAAVAADPTSASAQYLLGSIKASRDDNDGAIEAFNEVIRLNPRVQAAQIQLARLQLQKGAVPTATQFAEQAVKEAPKNLAARLVLARSLAAKGEAGRAQALMKELLAERPNLAPLHAQMGTLQLANHDNVGAKREFERALQLDPSSLEALRGLVVLLVVQDKNTPAARTMVDAAVQRAPKNIDLLMLQAAVFAAAGDPKNQEQTLRKVIEIDPANLAAFSALADVFVRTHRLEEAKAEYEELAKRQPKSVTGPTMVALILDVQNKATEAQKVYERIIESTPDAAIASNNLAWRLAESGGNLDVALQLAQNATRQLPKSGMVADTLGWVLLKKGMARQAVPSFLTSVEKDPKNAMFQYHLGLAYLKAGDRGKARAAFDEAIRLKPDYKEAAEARRTM